MASLAANRAAREAGGRLRSSGVNSFSRNPGVRSSVATKRSTSTTSIPTPMITGASLDGDGLGQVPRSEEHTSELQSRGHLVCRLLLEKKNREDQTGTGSETQRGQPP